jgi:hypothetical protein
MTRPQPPDTLRRWLAAERADLAAASGAPAVVSPGLVHASIASPGGFRAVLDEGGEGDKGGAAAAAAGETAGFDLADAALAELFAGQALAAPPAGFADRVLARVFTPDAAAAPALAPGVATPALAGVAPGLPRRRGRRRSEEAAAEVSPGALPGRRRHRALAGKRRWALAGRRRWALAGKRRWAALRLAPVLGLAAAALLAASLWLPFLLQGLRALVSASTISLALQGAIGAVEGFSQLVAALVSWGHTLLLLDMAVARPLTAPPVAALAALSLTISVLSLRSLHALIQRDRRWVYADPI